MEEFANDSKLQWTQLTDDDLYWHHTGEPTTFAPSGAFSRHREPPWSLAQEGSFDEAETTMIARARGLRIWRRSDTWTDIPSRRFLRLGKIQGTAG